MSEPETASTESDFEALKALQEDASELERIQNLLDRFNVFETIGFVGQELMHSRFLAFLLDPKQNHGLGDVFLRKTLRKASATSNTLSVLKVFGDVGNRNLEQTAVQTEVYTDDGRIDILLLNEVGKWAVIIENKVWSTEHSDQLDRYYRFVSGNHPGWRVLGIYLTPYGDAPSHEKYLPLGYAAVCKILDDVLENQSLILSLDVRISIEHYVQMVRRNIVNDSEIARLCQSLYRDHQRAFDLVFEHRFTYRENVRKYLIKLISETPRLIPDGGWINYPLASYVDFAVQEWDVPKLQVGSRDDRGNRILEFVFGNYPDHLYLDLQIRPGDEETRRKLFEMAYAHPSAFNGDKDSTSAYAQIFRRIMLQPSFYDANVKDTEREREIRRQWETFLTEDLPRIETALEKEKWIWESTEIEDFT